MRRYRLHQCDWIPSMLGICFFNRPLTIVPFILGSLMFLPFCFLGLPATEWPIFLWPFLFFFFSFSIIYNFCLIYYFLFSKGKVEIDGIDITFFSKPLFYVLALCFLWLTVGLIWLMWISLGENAEKTYYVFGFAIATFAGTGFLFAGLGWYAKQRFFREVLKNKADPLDFALGYYASIRKLLLERLIT